MTIIYRPVGPKELELIESAGWRAFPPRLPEQPIFYPVENEEYARQIARDWNVKSDEFLRRYPVQQVGGVTHREFWIPAEDLAALNERIVGQIELIATYRAEDASH